jgi:hypothetical protein
VHKQRKEERGRVKRTAAAKQSKGGRPESLQQPKIASKQNKRDALQRQRSLSLSLSLSSLSRSPFSSLPPHAKFPVPSLPCASPSPHTRPYNTARPVSADGLGFLGQRVPLASFWSVCRSAGRLPVAGTAPSLTRVRRRPWCGRGSRGRTEAARHPSAAASPGEYHREKKSPVLGPRAPEGQQLFPPGVAASD